MKLIFKIFILLACLTGLAGCNDSEPESAEPETTVFDPLVESLDKAQETQDLEQDYKRRIDEELDQD